MPYTTLSFDVSDRIATITVNRPDKLNALNAATIGELGQAIEDAVGRDDVGGVILTGAGRAFIAGADIAGMQGRSALEMQRLARRGQIVFRRFETSPKPVIAAVNGFALGGGCELAMACHVRLASEHAKFGQPEVKLGLIPGYGGTQRLPRAVGKAKAMEMALTGRMMDAAEADRSGLVSRVVPLEKLMDEALAAAITICDYSQIAVMAAKESINRAFESSLSDGVMFERRLFHAMFATADQKEGMDAFVGKRKPQVRNE